MSDLTGVHECRDPLNVCNKIACEWLDASDAKPDVGQLGGEKGAQRLEAKMQLERLLRCRVRATGSFAELFPEGWQEAIKRVHGQQRKIELIDDDL